MTTLRPSTMPIAGDDAGCRRLSVVLVVGDEQADLEKARSGIAEAGDAFARGELALLVLLGDAIRPAALAQLLLERAHSAHELAQSRMAAVDPTSLRCCPPAVPVTLPGAARSANQPRM